MPFVWNRGMFDAISGNVWGVADMRAMLFAFPTTPDRDADFVSDVAASELVTTNYARVAIAGEVIILDDANDRVLLDCNDVTFPNLGPTSGGPSAQAMGAFRSTGVDATSPLWIYSDFATPQVVNGSDFTVEPPSTGLAILTSP